MERQSFIQPVGYKHYTVVLIIIGSLIFGLGYLSINNPDSIPLERQDAESLKFIPSSQFIVVQDKNDTSTQTSQNYIINQNNLSNNTQVVQQNQTNDNTTYSNQSLTNQTENNTQTNITLLNNTTNTTQQNLTQTNITENVNVTYVSNAFDIPAIQYNKTNYRVSSDLYGKTDDFFQKRWSLPRSNTTYIQGMTFVSDRYCPNVTFGSEEALYSLKAIYSAGIDWVAIVVTEYQNNTQSNIISPVFDPIYLRYYTHISSSISGLTFIINAAHRIGLRVMLKPHIDLLSDRDGPWRGNIYANDPAIWFDSYTTMILKYAALSQALEVEMMSLECELIGMSGHTESWRQVIKEMREVYDGKLISATNYGGEEVSTQYWDALDYIGVDAYYLNWVQVNNHTVEEIMQQWSGPFQTMKALSAKFNKPVVITEIGFCSGYCQRVEVTQETEFPNYQRMQANQYEALIKLLEVNTDWLKGIFYWSWNSDPAFGGEKDICISPQYKQAEQVMRKYWGEREYISKPAFQAKCLCTL